MPRKRARSYPNYAFFLADALAPKKEDPALVRAREKADRTRPVGQVCRECGKPRSRYSRADLCSLCEDREKSNG